MLKKVQRKKKSLTNRAEESYEEIVLMFVCLTIKTIAKDCKPCTKAFRNLHQKVLLRGHHPKNCLSNLGVASSLLWIIVAQNNHFKIIM